MEKCVYYTRASLCISWKYLPSYEDLHVDRSDDIWRRSPAVQVSMTWWSLSQGSISLSDLFTDFSSPNSHLFLSQELEKLVNIVHYYRNTNIMHQANVCKAFMYSYCCTKFSNLWIVTSVSVCTSMGGVRQVRRLCCHVSPSLVDLCKD